MIFYKASCLLIHHNFYLLQDLLPNVCNFTKYLGSIRYFSNFKTTICFEYLKLVLYARWRQLLNILCCQQLFNSPSYQILSQSFYIFLLIYYYFFDFKTNLFHFNVGSINYYHNFVEMLSISMIRLFSNVSCRVYKQQKPP